MDSAKTEIRLQGIGASPGFAIGEAVVADRNHIAVAEVVVSPQEVPSEIRRFHEALGKARDELRRLRDELALTRGEEHLYVLDAHLLILDDPMLTRETCSLVESEHLNAESALKKTICKFRDIFSGIDDEYLRERGRDVEIVGERILRHMAGKIQDPLPETDGAYVIIAHDLSPADILQLDRTRVAGIVTDLGGRTSHTAILARSLEIPAVVGMEKATEVIRGGDPVIIDGASGIVEINPGPDTFRDYLRRKQHFEYRERELLKLRELPPVTRDGQRVQLQGNVEFVEEIESIRSHGGEGVGLYRTELLYMNRDTLPDEEEQTRAYAAVARAAAPHPVSIRTLDVGGDKFVAALNMEDELNPALGLRAIRFSLREPGIFKTQLRAILRASAFGRVRVFFPMVSGVAEIRQVKELLEAARGELRREKVAFDEGMEIGIMVEIPSAVVIADLLAREVDFFSVGTNDLIQYSLAVDRTNEHLSHLYEPLNPAILRSLKMVADAAHDHGIRACMCGEMAGDPQYLPILLGLGFDELSMNPVSIPRVKEILLRCTAEEAREVARQALRFATASEVDSYLKGVIAARFSESFD